MDFKLDPSFKRKDHSKIRVCLHSHLPPSTHLATCILTMCYCLLHAMRLLTQLLLLSWCNLNSLCSVARILNSGMWIRKILWNIDTISVKSIQPAGAVLGQLTKISPVAFWPYMDYRATARHRCDYVSTKVINFRVVASRHAQSLVFFQMHIQSHGPPIIIAIVLMQNRSRTWMHASKDEIGEIMHMQRKFQIKNS